LKILFRFLARLLLFGRGQVILTRLIVPTAQLLAVQSDVHRLCLPHLQPERRVRPR